MINGMLRPHNAFAFYVLIKHKHCSRLKLGVEIDDVEECLFPEHNLSSMNSRFQGFNISKSYNCYINRFTFSSYLFLATNHARTHAYKLTHTHALAS